MEKNVHVLEPPTASTFRGEVKDPKKFDIEL
jgi:hypothetical protein